MLAEASSVEASLVVRPGMMQVPGGLPKDSISKTVPVREIRSTYNFALYDMFAPILPAGMVLEEVFPQVQFFLCRTPHSLDGQVV